MSVPQDLVAIFHAAFHPLKGNIIDWSLKADPDIDLTNLEFNALPSGLHLVEHDIVYFSSKDGHQGVCAFLRVKSTETGHRGFRLSSLGVLLAKSTRPKPWRHVAALKHLITMLYARMDLATATANANADADANADTPIPIPIPSLQPTQEDWEPTTRYFERHKMQDENLGGAGDWAGWSRELELDGDTPTLHLPHLLRILGPSTLTLYKHVIGRKRILIYTLPPVQAACILCHVAADLCWEWQAQEVRLQQQQQQREQQQVDSQQVDSDRLPVPVPVPGRLPGRNKRGINVLGMITLSDVDRLQSLNSNSDSNSNNPDSNSNSNSNSNPNSNSNSHPNSNSTNSDSNSNSDSSNSRGWIACTTDAIFIERPAYYDLLIDLTTSTPHRATRPTFYASRPVTTSGTGSRVVSSQQSKSVSTRSSQQASTSTSTSSSRGPGRGPTPSGPTQTHRLSTIRFAWSDVRLWNELDRILRLDSSPYSSRCHPHSSSSSSSSSSSYPSSSSNNFSTSYSSSCSSCCTPSPSPSGFEQKPNPTGSAWTTWTDVWRVYEDVCLVCAGLWMGMGMGMGAYTRNGDTGMGYRDRGTGGYRDRGYSYRGNSIQSYSTAHGQENWGGVRLEGDDDLSVRGVGTGIGASGTGGEDGDGPALGLGIEEGSQSQSQSQSQIRSLGAGIEGRPVVGSPIRNRNLGAGIEGRPAPKSKSPISIPIHPGSPIRNLGAGIEGRPAPAPTNTNTSKPMKRTSGMIFPGSGFGYGKAGTGYGYGYGKAGSSGSTSNTNTHSNASGSGSKGGRGSRKSSLPTETEQARSNSNPLGLGLGLRELSTSTSTSTGSQSHTDRDGDGVGDGGGDREGDRDGERERERAREGAREGEGERERDGSDAQLLTTLALLQTFHAHTAFQLSVLESFLPPRAERERERERNRGRHRDRDRDQDGSDSDPRSTNTNTNTNTNTTTNTNTNTNIIYLTPKDLLAFELGPFSAVDERYLEWLGKEYGGGTEVLVRRGWKDLFGIVFGYL